ncbi:MAG: glycosyltransferase family 4 protein [Candidatus Diapherotrites archaeon]
MVSMDVLMLGWEFPPLKSGGLGTYLYHFTRELHKLGLSISLITPYTGKDISPGFVKILQAGPETEIIGIKSTLMPYATPLPATVLSTTTGLKQPYGWNLFEEVSYYTARAIEIGKKLQFKAIHCHDWMTFPAGIELKSITGKPLIATIHSTEFDRTGQLYPNEWIAGIEKTGLQAADKIITVSNFMKTQIVEKYSIPPEKITVVYNAIDLSHYSKKPHLNKPNEKIVLFVGRLTIQKGCPFFLEAAKKVLEFEPNARFIIVGSGDMLGEMIQKSIDLGISSNVTFTGFEENVSDYYSIADVFVMPSVSEPFGLTALEAMACMAPVIVSKQSGVSEVLRNVLKVDFWDVHELANKIIGVLCYEAVRSELQEKGFSEIQRFRNWGDVARETAKVYNEAYNGV